MRILSLCFSDLHGGAARSAYRLHKALLEAEVDAHMKVWSKLSDDITVEGPTSRLSKGFAIARPAIGQLVKGNFRTTNPVRHSAAWLPSGWLKVLNNSTADVLHLHWLGCETLTIREIGLLRKPVVWTFHDMWAFCGAEHYTDDGTHARWRTKYTSKNRPDNETGFDLNAWTWNRKQRYWQSSFHVVCPSSWLADCVRESELMRNWPVYVIPNPIDLTCFRPISKSLARQLLNLPKKQKLILFGAMGGGQDPRKGIDLLLHSLSLLKTRVWQQDEKNDQNQDVEIIIFGQSRPVSAPRIEFPIRYIEPLHDEISLALLYSSADVFILPSRQDNLPNTVIEASACGTPTVAFKVGGVPDLIKHQVSGYLAQPYDPVDLAQGIQWVLEQQTQSNHLGLAARRHAEEMFNPAVIAQQYLFVYQKALEAHQ